MSVRFRLVEVLFGQGGLKWATAVKALRRRRTKGTTCILLKGLFKVVIWLSPGEVGILSGCRILLKRIDVAQTRYALHPAVTELHYLISFYNVRQKSNFS